MRLLKISGLLLFAAVTSSFAAVPSPWLNADIGAVGIAGSASATGGTFTIKGSGVNIADKADGFQFVYQPLSGDGSITAHVVSQTRSNDYAKAGVMIRETLTAGAANAAVLLTPQPGAALQSRLSTGAGTGHLWGPSVTAPYWVRLVRTGNVFTGYTSADGAAWKSIGQYTIPMAAKVYAGLSVSSHDNTLVTTAVLDNVSFSGSAPAGDTVAPAVPTGLKSTAVTATSASIGWNASADNTGGTGVGGYYVYRNGATSSPYATVSGGATTFTDANVVASATYTYQVAAFDKATPKANVSAPSPAISVATPAAQTTGWSSGDIGAVGVHGASSVSNGVYTVKGSGANIWDTADAFQFIDQALMGDGSITAHVVSQSRSDDYAKAGVMIRDTLNANAANAAVLLTPNPGAVLQGRVSTGGGSAHIWGPSVTAPYWVRLTRAGNVYTGYTSADGTTWKSIGQYTISMGSMAYFGLAVSSHNNASLSTAVFDHVTVSGTPAGGGPAECDPSTFGAQADGVTDNTTPIQNAINACASQGGGVVGLHPGGASKYVSGPVQLKSHVKLQIDAGVTLQATNDHSRYAGADINTVYQPTEALVSAANATDVGIIGAGRIDGAGGQLQPNGSPAWWSQRSLPRPWVIEFYKCDTVAITGITIQNAPMWNQALRFSQNITESGVTVTSPSTGAPNTDGVDVVGSTNVVLTGLTINVGDDNIAIKSGLPFDPNDPKQAGIPRVPSSQIQISNVTIGYGRGIVIGSELANGVNNVTIEGAHFSGTDAGIRIKGSRDRGSNIYAISAKDITMSGVQRPVILADYYPDIDAPVEPPYQAAAAVTATTSFVHDVSIENLTATGAFGQSIIEGLPEACIQNVTLKNVNIQTKTGSQYLGLGLRHMTGTFTDVTSTPGGSNPPFEVQENVKVTVAGSTPSIGSTPPQAGQKACSAQ